MSHPQRTFCGILSPFETMVAAADTSLEYELFVLHAEPDAEFVHGYLLTSIGLDVDSPRVMLPAKYELGLDWLRNLERAVRGSRFTVLVISRAAHADRWTEVGGLLAQTLGAWGRHRLIPLVLDDTPLDLRIAYLETLDFRDRSQWDAQTARLRRSLGQPAPASEYIACPYPGFAPFQQADAGRFFGRDKQVHELVSRIEEARMLCVIGPSGSGKSSLVQAGVLPWLERVSSVCPPCVVRQMRPDADPMRQLAQALDCDPATPSDAVAALLSHRAGSRLVLFIDQLEELFALAPSAERAAFVAALRALRDDGRCRIIAALRADFFGSLMDSELWPDVEYGRCEVIPLRGAALRDAIVKPACHVGVFIEGALVERLLADTAAEPGALPLLQATLRELWEALEHRPGGTSSPRYLTLADYDALGEGRTTIATALARRADDALASLSPMRRRIARRVLMNLISFGEGRMHTRRQRSLDALRIGEIEAEIEAEIDATLAVLIERRLVTAGSGPHGPTIDLAHEALITAWPTLRSWIETGRADEERRRALAAKVSEWTEATERGFPGAKLLDAIELLDAERWIVHDAERVGMIPGLDRLVERSRAELEAIRVQRDQARRLLATNYQDLGRRLLLDGHPMRALPYLHAAREIAGARGEQEAPRSLAMLFAEAARVLPIAMRAHRDRIERATFSPDGACVVTAGRDGIALVWDATTGRLVGTPLRHDAPVLDAQFSPDGARLVTACADGGVRVWQLGPGAHGPGMQVVWLLDHAAKVHLASFSNDGRTILAAGWDHRARVWDAATGLPVSPPISHGGKITCARFSPDGRRIAIAGAQRAVQICDAISGARVFALDHADIVRDAMFSRDGSCIITASADRTARIWDALSGTLRLSIEHAGSVSRAELSPDGRRILTTCDASAQIWDAASGEPVSPAICHCARISDAAFSGDGTYVATASLDRTVRLSDAGSGHPLGLPFEHAREVLQAAIDRTGHRIVTTTADGTARVWDTTTARTTAIPLQHARRFVASVAFDRSGAHLVTAGGDGTARLWHATTGAALRGELRHKNISAASFAPDGAHVATVGGATAILWSTATGRAIHVFEHARPISTAAFSPDGLRIATAGRDGALKIWDTGTGELLVTHAHHDPVTGAWFSPDGRWLASACADGHARLWRGEDMLQVGGTARCLPHDGTVTHAAFDRDSRRIATASRDHTARIWDVASGAPCTPPLWHADEVRRVMFRPDGAQILTTSGSTAQVWDASSGRPALDPLEHRRRVHAARFSPDGALIATASEDGTAWLWDASSGRPVSSSLTHGSRVNDLAFSPGGRELAIASGDPIARVWRLCSDRGSYAAWSELVGRCPYALVDGVLVERRRDDSGESPAERSVGADMNSRE